VLVTKAKILGFGLNMQICTRQVFSSCHDCYDDKTEILTKDGWRSFGEVSIGDAVATVSPDTRAFEWQECSRVVWEPYAGPMIRFQGQRNFDLLVTPNHKLFVERCKTRFPNDTTGPFLKMASDFIERYRRSEYRMFSTASRFAGDVIDSIEIPPYGKRAEGPNSKSIDRISVRDFAMLVGWYVSEGYCRPVDSYEFGRIVISQTDVHPENREEIIGLLKRIGLSVNDKTKDITSYSRRLAKFLMDEFGTSSGTMRIPGWVKNLDGEILVTIRDTMIKGDGCHSGGIPRFYRTISKQLADDFQEICIKTGVRGSIHSRERTGSDRYSDPYDVCLAWENTSPSIYNEPEVVQYDGMIGCVTVPNHIVIVRRNGIPVVSGNSYEEYFQAVMRSNRVGSTRPLNVHLPVTEAERIMMENVLRKADRVEEDTRVQERLFKEMALATA
jgi:replicative DNA helicase Mcm